MALETRLPVAAGFWQGLRDAYATPPRHYHDFDHVRAVLAHYDEVSAEVGWQQPDEVLLAVLFHDAVYQVGRADNEAASARLAASEIERWLGDREIEVARVVELIELTARHGSLTPEDVDRDAALFLDCDMAILGASPAGYQAYAAAVARELADIAPPDAYRAGRRAFLERVLDKPRIFLSDHFHRRLDAQARRNLRAEIEALEAGASG